MPNSITYEAKQLYLSATWSSVAPITDTKETRVAKRQDDVLKTC